MKKTRWISLLMAVAMMLTLLPLPAAAKEKAPTGVLHEGKNGGYMTVEIPAEFNQKSARSMLSLINDFRTGKNAWEWNEKNTKKEYHTNLGKLSYDYDLEQIAMQRAVEIGVSFSHIRPNGEVCFSLTHNGMESYGENIAVTYRTGSAKNVFEMWQETNEPYEGQGHRRNMLQEGYTSVGIGCAIVGDFAFWVQEFSVETKGTPATKPTQSSQNVPVDVAVNAMEITELSAKPVEVTVGKTTPAPQAQLRFRTASTYLSGKTFSASYIPKWSVKNSSLVQVKDGSLKGLRVGKTNLMTELGNKKLTVPVSVLLPAPTVTVEYRENTGKPVVSWTPVDGAKGYEVWYSADGGQFKSLYSTEDGTRVNHGSAKPGVEYSYKVRAMGSTAGRFSSVQPILCTCAQPQVRVTLKDSKPYLTWNEIDGADKYEVWCSVDGGKYTLLHTTEGTRLRNGSAKANEKRSYKVKAIVQRNRKADSPLSQVVSVTCPLPVLKKTGVNLTSKATTGKPYLTWDKVSSAEKYEVWMREGKNGTYKKLYTTTGTHLTHSSANAGTTYYYQVRAVAGTVEGPFSDVKHRTCDLPQPKVTCVLHSGDPYLTWDKVRGAEKYEVWCADGKGDYTRLYTTKGTHLTHGSAKKGHTYKYKVRAICSNSYGNSAYSTSVSVKVK